MESLTRNAENAGELAVREALAEFMKGFEPLNANVLANWMAPNITAFLPFAPGRVDGREAVKAAFEDFFSGLRHARPDASSLRLVPERLEIQMVLSIAIVSFELRHPASIGRRTLTFTNSIGRRTLTFTNQDGSWRILHLHASEYESL